MLPRRPVQRKYRPGLEALEPKQLLSAGPRIHRPEALVWADVPAPSRAELGFIHPDGTGKGTVIITS